MAQTTLLLVRHPETVANVEGRFVGRGDAPYTQEGQRQFEALRERIISFAPTRVSSSPLRRAFVLGEAAAEDTGAAFEVDERLIELDFGDAEGLTWDEIKQRGLVFDYRTYDRPVAPNGESRAAIEHRAAEIAAELVAAGGRRAVCTHGGVFRAMLVSLLGLSRTDIWAFHIHNGAVAEVRVVDGHGMLEEFTRA